MFSRYVFIYIFQKLGRVKIQYITTEMSNKVSLANFKLVSLTTSDIYKLYIK